MARRVLFIAPISVCGEPASGGEQRTLLIFNALADRYAVDVMIVGAGVAAMHRKPFGRAAAIYEALHAPPSDALPLRVLHRYFPTGAADKIASTFTPRARAYEPDSKMLASLASVDFSAYDLIVARFLRPAARAGAFAPGQRTPVIVDLDDRDDLVFASRLRRNRFNPALGALNRWHAAQAVTILRQTLPAARHIWVVGEEDREGFDGLSISQLPNIPFAPLPKEAAPAPAEGKTLLFVGNAGHEPNRLGAMRFLKKCWPAIVRAEPGAALRIVGRGWERLPPGLAALSGVEVAGFVDDLGLEYRRAVFAVSPVYDGAGVKTKVIEALSHGRAVVADIHSTRGVPPAVRADCILSADGDKEMIEACLGLLRRPEEAARRGLAGRAHALASFTRERFEEIVLSDCERVLAETAPAAPLPFAAKAQIAL
ncbi:MAG: glycosyltransferase family 4 protein [Pseudomonadota bacterium]|nr:glycosyltransferase family 4 protein [Pseudomonadota bacterium]